MPDVEAHYLVVLVKESIFALCLLQLEELSVILFVFLYDKNVNFKQFYDLENLIFMFKTDLIFVDVLEPLPVHVLLIEDGLPVHLLHVLHGRLQRLCQV